MAGTALTPEQLAYIAEQPASNPIWGALGSEQFNPYLAEAKAAWKPSPTAGPADQPLYDEQGNIAYDAQGYAMYGDGSPKTFEEYQKTISPTGSLARLNGAFAGLTAEQIMQKYDADAAAAQAAGQPAPDKTMYLTAASNKIGNDYAMAIDAIKWPGYTAEYARTYNEAANGGTGMNSAVSEFSDAAQSMAGNFVIPAATLGLSNFTSADEKLLSQEAQKNIDPGLQAVSGATGAGAYAGNYQASQANPSGAAEAGTGLAEYGSPGYQPYGEYGSAGYTAAGAGAGATAGVGAGIGAGTAAGAGLASTAPSLLQTGAALLPSVLGYVGADNQTDALNEQAALYASYGAPYRQQLSDLYADPSSFLTSDRVQVPVQQGTDMLARSLSMGGNPVGSGNALQELQSYSTNQLYGQFGAEADRLAGFGGLTQYNQAAPQAATNAIGSEANKYNAIGSGVESLMNLYNPPKPTYLSQYYKPN